MSAPRTTTDEHGRDATEPRHLFAYGTLGPVDRGAARRDRWTEAAVRGRLYDLGPYPALVAWADPSAGWVEGHVRAVDRAELEAVLDPYEGTDVGLFRRVALRTRSGVRAWAYVYPHPIPRGARGPITRWDGRRIDLGPTRPPESPRRGG